MKRNLATGRRCSINTIWHKVWRDLARNKLRTVLAVLSTAVGVFALGLVFGMSGMMRERMTASHRATLPAHVNVWGGPFDDETVMAVSQEPGVAEVELMIWQVPLRWKLEGETGWRDGGLYARQDYDAQRMDLIDLLEGSWPAERTLAVENRTGQYSNIPINTDIIVEFGRYERRLPVTGVVRLPLAFPPQLGGAPVFYATADTIAWLTGHSGFDDLYIRMDSFSQEGAEELAKRVIDRLERMGLSVGGPRIIDPNVHWLQEQVDTMFVILTILGALSLGLSAFLIVNTMNAIVAQQVWQIGVMKTVGATFGRVVGVYLTITLVYGLLACLVAIPLSAVAAHSLAGWLLGFMNVTAGSLRFTPTAVAIQVAVGLVIPMLAALAPVIGGARITPHRAISTYGLGAGFGHNWLDRLVGRIRFLARPLAFSLRNTFRRKARVALTLLTLTLGGVMFIVVMSVGASFDNTIEVMIGDFGYDATVSFDRWYSAERLIEIAESVPGVVSAEIWNSWWPTMALPNGEEREIFLRGVPPDSTMYSPRIVSGRGLRPGDGRAILLNHEIAVEEGFRVGDEITLDIDGRESVWTVVGLLLSSYNSSSECAAPIDTLARETGHVNRGSTVVFSADQHDAEAQEAAIGRLRDAYATHNLVVTWSRSASEFRERNRSQFSILTYLLLTMAALAALVGSLGLMGTMSINVVERGREIGVMRAIGATSLAIAGIFVGEGVLLGVLSWLFAVPLSYPGARAFGGLVGNTLMQLPLDLSYSTSGVLMWLGIVVVISALASLWPAWRATRVSVREALAYE